MPYDDLFQISIWKNSHFFQTDFMQENTFTYQPSIKLLIFSGLWCTCIFLGATCSFPQFSSMHKCFKCLYFPKFHAAVSLILFFSIPPLITSPHAPVICSFHLPLKLLLNSMLHYCFQRSPTSYANIPQLWNLSQARQKLVYWTAPRQPPTLKMNYTLSLCPTGETRNCLASSWPSHHWVSKLP